VKFWWEALLRSQYLHIYVETLQKRTGGNLCNLGRTSQSYESRITQLSYHLKGLWLLAVESISRTIINPAAHQLMLRLLGRKGVACVAPPTRCVLRIAPRCMWCEQAIIEWGWCVFSIAPCYHSVKLCMFAFWALLIDFFRGCLTQLVSRNNTKSCHIKGN